MKKNQKLIEKFFKGECSKDELLEVYHLFEKKNSDKQVFDYLEDEWENFEEDRYLLPGDFDELYAKTVKKSKTKSSPVFRTLKIAASITLISMLSFMAYWFVLSPDYLGNVLVYNEVTTKRGETKVVRLSDGSEILLNAASTIRYPKKITEDNRSIYIDGAAYFKVSDQSTQLLVHADEISAEVSGASFNISAYGDDEEITIAVEKGGDIKTKVPMFKLTPATQNSDAETDQALDPDYGRSIQTLIVSTDEYFSYNKAVRKSVHDKYQDDREYFAWVDGVIFFKDTDLEQTLKQLSRTFDVDFDLRGCVDENLTFSGEYKDQSLQTILDQEGLGLDARYVPEKQRVVLTGHCN